MSNIRTDAGNIKKEYIKSRFVDAAKSIILQDGVTSVTARRVAELTGYSYATIYHYFSDLNDLLLAAKLAMIHDMVHAGEAYTIRTEDPLERIKEYTRIPIDFFIGNPNVFRFFYAYPMDERNETAMKSLELEKAYWGNFLPFAEKGAIKKSDIPAISRTILYAVYGMITLYLSNNGLSKEEVYHDMDNTIDLLLKGSCENEKTR